jgi:hypothetical protein
VYFYFWTCVAKISEFAKHGHLKALVLGCVKIYKDKFAKHLAFNPNI